MTDHLSLKYLLSLCLLSFKDTREKLARWVIEVQYFDLAVKHQAGPGLVVPDTLNRDSVQKPFYQRFHSPMDCLRLEELRGAEAE